LGSPFFGSYGLEINPKALPPVVGGSITGVPVIKSSVLLLFSKPVNKSTSSFISF